ncbi:hypothetical protein BDP27DRAFT_1365987 [Rhodocollybia butyracea]|uniref:Uncharacterized protein n=1 Tax=Rhodocollybia butyracea TaxID=206335 RepID=A0A9P5PMG0_9AGAR|nr:hypothetical protein BDP27DRAFT_1365987 [Rhodocollybia butyracea]
MSFQCAGLGPWIPHMLGQVLGQIAYPSLPGFDLLCTHQSSAQTPKCVEQPEQPERKVTDHMITSCQVEFTAAPRQPRQPRPPTTNLQPIGLWVFPYVSTTSDPESAHTRTTKNYKVPIDLEIPAPKNLSVLALIKELISSVSLHEFNFASQNFAITLSSPSLLSSFAMRLFPSICYTTSPTLKPSAKRSFGVLIELLRDAMGIIVLTAFLGTVTSAQASAQHWTVAERGSVRVHVRRWRHGTAALRSDSVSSPWSMAWIVRSSKKLRTSFVPTVAPAQPPAQHPASMRGMRGKATASRVRAGARSASNGTETSRQMFAALVLQKQLKTIV